MASSATSTESGGRRRAPSSEVHGTARLTIEIAAGKRKFFYVVVPHKQADRRAVARAWRLKKADGSSFDVAQTDTGFECDCEDFIYRKRNCKHIRALQVCGLLPQEAS